ELALHRHDSMLEPVADRRAEGRMGIEPVVEARGGARKAPHRDQQEGHGRHYRQEGTDQPQRGGNTAEAVERYPQQPVLDQPGLVPFWRSWRSLRSSGGVLLGAHRASLSQPPISAPSISSRVSNAGSSGTSSTPVTI